MISDVGIGERILKNRWFIMTGLVAMSLLIAPLAQGTVCATYWVQTTATVCAAGECTSTIYFDAVIICTEGGGGSGGGGSGGGGGWLPSSPFDFNSNGKVDSWRDVIITTDGCANNFDTNDRLGVNHGGPNNTPGRKSHSGVDIQANRNDLIFSMMSGVVVAVTSNSTCGSYVKVRHGDSSKASYCHMVSGSQSVAVGDSVFAGQLLGLANSTGNSTGDHLHITFRDEDGVKREYFNYVDNPPSSSQLNPGGC